MEFKLNSNLANFYRWFYSDEDWQYDTVRGWYYVMPKDTCTYYKQLIKALLLIIPMTLLSFPVMIYYAVTNKKESAKEKWKTAVFIYFIIALICLFVFLLVAPFLMYFGEYGQKTTIFKIFPVGVLLWIGLICVGIYHGIAYIISRINGNIRKTIVGSYIKSVKEKYCEQITWK